MDRLNRRRELGCSATGMAPSGFSWKERGLPVIRLRPQAAQKRHNSRKVQGLGNARCGQLSQVHQNKWV